MTLRIPAILSILLGGVWTPTARSQEGDAAARESVILFKLTSDEANAPDIDLINAEVFMVLQAAGRYELIPSDELADDLMMSPEEALDFCKFDPACIADLGAEKKARWILYGHVKLSFDQSLVLVQLTWIDVPGKKVHEEKFGKIDKEANVVVESGNLVRELVGLPVVRPKPKPDPLAVKEPDLAPKPLPAPPPGSTVVVTKPPGRRSPWSNPWMWTAAGIGVASLATGIILGVTADQRLSDARSPGYDQPTAYGMVQEARDYALGANIALGVGGAALAGAVVLFVLDVTSDEPRAAPSLACSTEGCTAVLLGRF